jgi:exodeoxyribonuclease VIII
MSNETTSKPEMRPGLTFDEYCAIDAVNVTKLLSYLDQSPEEALWEQVHQKGDTAATTKGHAAHAALLEPEAFERDYAACPKFGRKKADLDLKAKWEAEHANSVQVSDAAYNEAIAIRDSILKNPDVNEFFTGKGQNEVTVVWTDEETRLLCKARIDRITFYHGYPTVLDLKTASDIDVDGIHYAVMKYHYHIRLASYVAAMNALKPANYLPAIVWVKNTPPYTARATQFDEPEMKEGLAGYRHLLTRHAECAKANYWPGYKGAPEVIEFKPWDFRFTNPQR